MSSTNSAVSTTATAMEEAPQVQQQQQPQQQPQRPQYVRRTSTLLLQGEHEPEIDEDMEFHKLNLAPGAQVNPAKPLSRAGSGEEIQLGDDYNNGTVIQSYSLALPTYKAIVLAIYNQYIWRLFVFFLALLFFLLTKSGLTWWFSCVFSPVFFCFSN